VPVPLNNLRSGLKACKFLVDLEGPLIHSFSSSGNATQVADVDAKDDEHTTNIHRHNILGWLIFFFSDICVT
jgi:hypothetical protein